MRRGWSLQDALMLYGSCCMDGLYAALRHGDVQYIRYLIMRMGMCIAPGFVRLY
jgi:hypothetical protein